MSEEAHSILDTVGTWAGAALAGIALIGIASSWLVLRELHSERTNALNYLHDHDDPPFISRGWRYGRRARLFRKIRVPDLTPYDAWAAGSTFVVPRTDEAWVLGAPREPSCRTGWARLCRLLGAYEYVAAGEKKKREQVSLAKGGDLVIEDGETWLPVSRYWILVLGLLGRYGIREDRGVHFKFAERVIRPDLVEQLFWVPQRVEKGRRASMMPPPMPMPIPMPVRRPPPSQVWGTTGSFEVEGWHHQAGEPGPRNKRDRVRFTMHIKGQLGPLSGGDESVRFMFWLAIGFMPCTGGRKTPVSLEVHMGSSDLVGTPANAFNAAASSETTASTGRPNKGIQEHWQTFEYIVSRGEDDEQAFPVSLYEAGQALGYDFDNVSSFTNTTEKYLHDATEREHITQCARQEISAGTRRWLHVCPPPSDWSRGPVQFVPLFRREDVQSLADSVLDITSSWHPWSYLVRRDGPNLLRAVLRDVPQLIKLASAEDYGPDDTADKIAQHPTEYRDRLSRAMRDVVRGGGLDPAFDQRMNASLLGLVDLLQEPFPGGCHHRKVLGILYTTNSTFRGAVHALLRAGSSGSSGVVAKLDGASKELTWLFGDDSDGDSDDADEDEKRGEEEDDDKDADNDDNDDDGDVDDGDGDDDRDEEALWVLFKDKYRDEYPGSGLAKTHPLSVVVCAAGDGSEGSFRVMRMTLEDLRAKLDEDDDDDGGDDEKVIEVRVSQDEYSDIIGLDEMVDLLIMGDEYDSEPLLKRHSVSHVFERGATPAHRVVRMTFRQAMDLMRAEHDGRGIWGRRSGGGTDMEEEHKVDEAQSSDDDDDEEEDSDDESGDEEDEDDGDGAVYPKAKPGDVFQLDVPFEGDVSMTGAVTELTRDEVILGCLWAAAKCALWLKSPDSDPLMRMVQQLSDVVLVS